MINTRRLTALAFVALLALTGAACGDDDDGTADDSSTTSQVETGDQQGSGSDGSVVENPPGATPGGSQSGDDK